MLQIIVHDTGIGMSEETRHYLYQQLTNLDSISATDEEVIDREDATIDTEPPVKLGSDLSLIGNTSALDRLVII